MSLSANDALKALFNDPERVERMARELMAERQARLDAELAFFQGPVCERLLEDLIASGQSLDSEEWSYESKRVRQELGWGEEVSDEDVQLLFACMIRDDLPMDGAPERDPENPFEHFTLRRRGVSVFFMTGQGSFTRLTPEGLIGAGAQAPAEG